MNEKKYLVSILVPVYRVEKYIERCAKSLLEQTYDNIEYIFVDDCSPDRSISILKQIVKAYQFDILTTIMMVKLMRKKQINI